MTSSEHQKRGRERALALCIRLYGLFLYAYPAPFRRAYGERLSRVFRDSCRATLSRHGRLALLPLWGQTFVDLMWTACGEHWQRFKEHVGSLTSFQASRHIPARLWVALVATLLAFSVELIASLHLFLLEDASPLSKIASSTSPLFRFSYDVVYLSALASGITVCAVVGHVLVHRPRLVTVSCVLLTFLIAFGGFGGLLVHHPVTFLIFLLLLLLLTLSSFLLGHMAMARASLNFAPRPAAVLGACGSAGMVLLINLVALVLHTLILNPVNHTLYMQGQITGTHLNFSLMAMVLAIFTGSGCMVCLRRAFHVPSQAS